MLAKKDKNDVGKHYNTHQIVASDIDANLAIDNINAEFFGKNNLDRSGFTLGHYGKEKGDQKGIREHAPHHLERNSDLQALTIGIEKTVSAPRQAV